MNSKYAPTHGLQVSLDPKDKSGQRRILSAKGDPSGFVPPLAYRIVKNAAGVDRIVWEGEATDEQGWPVRWTPKPISQLGRRGQEEADDVLFDVDEAKEVDEEQDTDFLRSDDDLPF